MLELPLPKDDGLYIPKVGEWSRDKHEFLRKYMDAFTSSMKSKDWPSLHYIDLFAGAGIERLKHSCKLDWGSPMLAAQTRYPFTKLHLCEKVKKKYDALKARINALRPNSQILKADTNDSICLIMKEIPARSLTLAFLDPYGLHLDFETIKILAGRRADLIIFFPDYLDALRNWERNYLNNPNSNLDRCFGPGADWRAIIDKTPQHRLPEVLRQIYVDQIRSLGYTEFEYQRIGWKGHPLYVLIFCSRHPLATKLWRGISTIGPNGQRKFDFDKNK